MFLLTCLIRYNGIHFTIALRLIIISSTWMCIVISKIIIRSVFIALNQCFFIFLWLKLNINSFYGTLLWFVLLWTNNCFVCCHLILGDLRLILITRLVTNLFTIIDIAVTKNVSLRVIVINALCLVNMRIIATPIPTSIIYNIRRVVTTKTRTWV